jgi:RNA polymerase sigma-70 factor (ECF subfamily)
MAAVGPDDAGEPSREPEEFDALFRRAYPPLVRALAVADGPDAAVDAVQDAFVQALRHWKRISAYDDPAAWVRRVAVNRLANQRRKRRRGERATARLGIDQPAELTPTDVDLAAAVAALPDGQRRAITLHYLADLSVDQVADAMSIAPGTVKSQLHDARRALRAALEVPDDV